MRANKATQELQRLTQEMVGCEDLQPEEVLSAVCDAVRVEVALSAHTGCKALTLREDQLGAESSVEDLEALMKLSFNMRFTDNLVGSLSTEDQKSVSKFFIAGVESQDTINRILDEMAGALSRSDDGDEAGNKSVEKPLGSGENWLQV